MSSKKKLKDARALAMKGKADAAIALLREIPAKDLPEAAHTLMELLAYRDDWASIHALGLEILEDHEAVYSSNAYADSLHLFTLASIWSGEKSTKAFLGKLKVTLGKKADDSYVLMADRALKVLASKGEENPFEHPVGNDPAGFAEAVAELDVGAKGKPAKKDKRYWEDYFNLAVAYNMPDKAWKTYQDQSPAILWSDALYLARCRTQAGKAAEAWKVLAKHLPEWTPVDAVQVLPLEPILWPELRPLLTPERKKEILATPKG